MYSEIKKISDIFSVAGYESELTSFIVKETKEFCDECYIDNIGNVICHKSGKGKKILVNIPISSDGVFITHISDGGEAKFAQVGKMSATSLLGAKVKNSSGKIVGIISSCDKKEGELSEDDLYIDTGVFGKESAEKIISIGEVLEPCGELYEIGDNIYGPKLSKTINILIGISVIKEIKSESDLYFAFSVMDNLGFKGAKTAATSINPEFSYVLASADTSNKNTKIELKKGTVIRIKDKFIIVNKSLRESLIKNLSKEKIPYQLEIVAEGGIPNNEIMYSGNGVLTANINCPVKSLGTLNEGINLSDVENVLKSLKVVLV